MDAAGIRLNCGNAEQREIGKGGINFVPMLAAAKNRSKYYFMERDPVAVGGPTNFNPFTNTENALKAMRADPAPTLFAAAPVFTSQPAGTVASAANAVPVVVTNDGDAPLTITNITVAGRRHRRRHHDRGRLRRSSARTASAPATSARWRRASSPWPTTRRPPTSTRQPRPSRRAPARSTSAFKPTRTNYTSVARLQFTSNSDDAVERVLLAAKSTGDAIGTVGGNVPSMLALSLPTQPGSFGTFQPTVARTYETAMAASVTSTAGDGDAVGHRPEHLGPGPPRQRRVRAAVRAERARHPTPPTRRRRTRRWPRPPAPRRTC